MADVEPSSPSAANFAETLQYRATQSRRARPPAVEPATADSSNRVPLRSENRLSRRDSRLGLRSIFGRAKAAREIDPSASYFDTGRPNSIRASLAEISNWPYMRSELAIPGASSSRPTSVANNNVPFNDASLQGRPSTTERTKPQHAPAKSSRGNLATWDPPPLFQAYPQAIKHAQLPTATTSADVILRLTDRKGSVSIREDLTHLALTPELADEQLADRAVERARKKHLRTLSTVRLEWTSKIYVLCTSGYLLQYNGDGNFDRLPEKVLHLSKDSAAFVSDAIPGKHWVLQVSSAMESNGVSSTDSRGLLSRLPFRAADKRHAANFLMVFDSAEEMESWIAILRREIESLGGKKTLSETGRPKADPKIVQLRGQPSQRTLVVRDPDRFSRALPPDFSLQLEQARLHQDDRRQSVVDADVTRDPSIDDISTTNSIISHDGRQLESLRDSTNRLSYISSGQRTFLTSAGSSPACSPVRDSFASSHLDELPPAEQDVPAARPRPNAAAILDRRQSLQTSGYLELRGSPMSRPQSTFTEADFAHVAANFSVPMSRRYSAVKSPPSSPEQTRSNRDSISRIARKPPPTALAMARPLSIVADQPSPASPAQGLEISQVCEEERERPNPNRDSLSGFPPRQTSFCPKERAVTVTFRTSPRKYASSPSLNQLEGSPSSPGLRTFILPSKTPSPASSSGASHTSPRPQSSFLLQSPAQRATQRLSAFSVMSYSPRSEDAATGLPRLPESASVSPKTVPRSSPRAPTTPPTPSSKQLRADHSRVVLGRRSMPQLVEGPPPAPPPSCALPPIPRKARSKA
ncbi:peptidase family M20/M25/M40 protein [Colletotrichum orchidophilum]|uniref:Peptidase family M20/M25/M40 protein n=1 Tax=Colletotrichum orchidophilum TaxID=1209926 RepID=A0A1G4BJH5_9PEZI|nr:peptidase family M20/M25/M40 protein [Colletotrichum orchidophilum]OHF01466.1 peptidase family M20/M25/M40 protein [Colletotrichum orchidophilum]